MRLYELLSIKALSQDATVSEAFDYVIRHPREFFKPNSVQQELKLLNAEWHTVELNTEFDTTATVDEVRTFLQENEIAFKDELGGTHEAPLGWNPNGVFCGECNKLSCVGCSAKDKKQ